MSIFHAASTHALDGTVFCYNSACGGAGAVYECRIPLGGVGERERRKHYEDSGKQATVETDSRSY